MVGKEERRKSFNRAEMLKPSPCIVNKKMCQKRRTEKKNKQTLDNNNCTYWFHWYEYHFFLDDVITLLYCCLTCPENADGN